MKQLLKYILSLSLEHQKMAETKHSIVLAVASGIIVVLLGMVQSLKGLAQIVIYLSIGLSVMSILSSFVALNSKSIIIKSKHKWNKKDVNLTYFKHIAKLDYNEYKKLLLKSYNFPQDYLIDNFENDLVKQIIASSKRITSKYNAFNVSCWLLFLSVGIAVLSVLIGGININAI